jgi:hypothetical protein
VILGVLASFVLRPTSVQAQSGYKDGQLMVQEAGIGRPFGESFEGDDGRRLFLYIRRDTAKVFCDDSLGQKRLIFS